VSDYTMEFNILLFLNLAGMILGAILAISGFFASFLEIVSNNEDKAGEDIFISFISIIVCVISIVLLGIGLYKSDKAIWALDKEPYATENIIALSDNNLTHGRLYLRKGYLNESLYYQYMVDLGDGGMINNKVAAQSATVYYDNDTSRVEWYHREKHWLWFKYKSVCHKIYIPKGSVSEEFNIDLK